jgi:radical SAM enzyme (TIGR01210 family)
MSEQEAIEDAVASIRFAFEAGSHTVSLSCATVQQGSLLCEKWRKREYRPPWLWSVVEVIRQTIALGPVRVGTFDDEPEPLDVPHNCGACDGRLSEALERYRQTMDAAVLVHETACCECTCRNTYLGLKTGETGDV